MTTTAILNNLFSRKNIQESIDLSQDKILLGTNYLKRHESDTPVKTVSSTWKNVEYNEYNGLNKNYKFVNKNSFMYFINEVLSESQRINHDIKMVIDGLYVEIILYTRDYNDVTDIDLKISKSIDEIYEDVMFIRDL